MEPQHTEWSQDSEFYSQNFNKAGMNYELGISLDDCYLVWMNDGFKAATNDIKHSERKASRAIFRQRERRWSATLVTVAAWSLCPHQMCMTVRQLCHLRARLFSDMRNFNDMTKVFEWLSTRFWLGAKKFSCCFEAVCVVYQYQVESEKPLFDILVKYSLIRDNEEYVFSNTLSRL